MKHNLLLRRIYSKASIKRTQNKIDMLGPNNKIDINRFLTIKLLLLIVVFVLILFVSSIGYILAPLITILVYFLYDYIFLDYKIKRRSNDLEHDSIFFFQVLALTIQSENNLKMCLEITSDSIDSEFSNEVKQSLNEVKLGKSLTEALQNLHNRIPSKAIKNVILNLIEANLYGNSIVDALQNQIDYITDKRILDIKSQINKIPTKISIVSVLFFIPLILMLILSPLLIQYFFK